MSRFSFSMASSAFGCIRVGWTQNFAARPSVADNPAGGFGVPGEQRLWKLEVVALLK